MSKSRFTVIHYSDTSGSGWPGVFTTAPSGKAWIHKDGNYLDIFVESDSDMVKFELGNSLYHYYGTANYDGGMAGVDTLPSGATEVTVKHLSYT